ncbi:MAG: ATP-dependent Clp protease adaptor ClpS, partial [Flavobacteriales bacterium]|nr:ATP-dependent Clp protease adaptor ClpS [Flavobacteriales bacterium]
MTKNEKTQVDSKIKEDTGSKHELILFNDDVNTFDFVIDALVQVCGH